MKLTQEIKQAILDGAYAMTRNGEWHKIEYIPNTNLFNFIINRYLLGELWKN